jgi:hypothetical protein
MDYHLTRRENSSSVGSRGKAAGHASSVVPADVVDDRPAGCGPDRPGLQVGGLAFKGDEEALGKGVVPALAGPAEGQHYLVPDLRHVRRPGT